ncbi:hypothetical protein PSm6_31520 [Pseudomonas solani]|uniref:Uncharacterized protein n=1 Tax=Pseudomonas solani TaxID=2731552 RepID=A0ABM7LAY4_9PSED|nr:hypothetical protein PSm6_31520 [Pseudomonas solani]
MYESLLSVIDPGFRAVPGVLRSSSPYCVVVLVREWPGWRLSDGANALARRVAGLNIGVKRPSRTPFLAVESAGRERATDGGAERGLERRGEAREGRHRGDAGRVDQWSFRRGSVLRPMRSLSISSRVRKPP